MLYIKHIILAIVYTLYLYEHGGDEVPEDQAGDGLLHLVLIVLHL